MLTKAPWVRRLSIRFASTGTRTADRWNSLVSDRVSGVSTVKGGVKHTPSNSHNETSFGSSDSEISDDIQQPLKSGKESISSSLQGTTFVAKDNFTTTKEPTSSGSQTLANYTSPFEATVITLLESSGSQLVGKTNLDEFGMGSSTTNSFYGNTTNPVYSEEDRIAGGSSGGSAAAVASGAATFSLGTDTGGSVRQPASYCQVIGFKPTYGRISRWGVVPYAQSLDTVGIFGKDVDVVHNVYKVLDRYDSKDPTSIMPDIRNKINNLKSSKKTYSFGIPSQLIVEELSEEIREKWLKALLFLQEQGHSIRSVSIPSVKQSLSAYYTLATAEAASNLSRYDGIRYGYNSQTEQSANELISENRSTAFGKEVQRRIVLGNYTLSSSSGDHYLRATGVREQLVRELNEVFNVPSVLLSDSTEVSHEKCDFLISPTAFGEPPTITEYLQKNEENFLNAYINDVLTVPASMAGLPAISVPFEGVGLQIMGQFGDDVRVLQVAKIIGA